MPQRKALFLGGTAFVAVLAFGGVLLARPAVRKMLPKPLPKGECTWYAWERAAESGWEIKFDLPYGRHAKEWPKRVVNASLVNTPEKGDLLILDAWPGNPYGHVVYVEEVKSPQSVVVTHANMKGGNEVRKLDGVTVRRAEVSLGKGRAVFSKGAKPLPVIGFLRRPR